MTLNMEFNPDKMAVVGRIQVSDPEINEMIETGRLDKVSIEQIPMNGETCTQIACEQHGVAFIGMALLETNIPPGDSEARIVKTEKMAKESFENLLVSDGQRTCVECSDFVPCHTCKHKIQAEDDCMDKHIKELQSAHPDWQRDQLIAVALKKCGLSNEESAWPNYRKFSEIYKSIPN